MQHVYVVIGYTDKFDHRFQDMIFTNIFRNLQDAEEEYAMLCDFAVDREKVKMGLLDKEEFEYTYADWVFGIPDFIKRFTIVERIYTLVDLDVNEVTPESRQGPPNFIM